jgi:hypothetical protein
VFGLFIVVVISWSLATACGLLLGLELKMSIRYANPLMDRALKGMASM